MRVYFKQTALELSEARSGRITASSVGAILGVDKFRTRDDVMRKMVRDYHGKPSEFTGNIATQWGHDNEPNALKSAQQSVDFEIEACTEFVAYDYDGMKLGASPDAIRDSGLVEIKCPYAKRNKAVSPLEYLEANPQYYAQMQMQMLCADKQECLFFVWTTVGSGSFSVARDDEYITDTLLPALKAFWADYQGILASDELSAPYLADKKSEYTERDDADFVSLADQYKTVCAEIDALQKNKEELEARLFELCGQNTKGAGLTIYQAERKGTVDYKKVPELEGVNLDQYRKPSTQYWTIKRSGK